MLIKIKDNNKKTQMNSAKFDKLAQIKKKYGYSPQKCIMNQPKVQLYNHKKQQSEISSRIQQQIHSSRIQQQKYFSQYQLPNQSYPKKQSVSAFSAYHQYPRTSSIKNTTFNAFQLIFEGPNNKKALQQSQNNQNKIDSSSKVTQNFLESYEKTYDLLKNFRQKVKTSFQNQAQSSQKILQINPKKHLRKENDKQNHSPEPKQSNVKLQRGRQNSIKKPTQNQRRQQIAKISVKYRQSFLEGIDMNKTDLKAELGHIQKLQHKIQSVLGLNQK